jgi:hypothetical protein
MSASPSAVVHPNRIGGFARYLKRYMAASAIVTAALPVPAAAFRLIPAYDAQRGFLGVYTSLFSFLILAFLFYSRHAIARHMFVAVDSGSYRAHAVASWTPLGLIACALASVFAYHALLDASIGDRLAMFVPVNIPMTSAKALEDTAASEIPRATLLMVLYLAIFLFAEAAFVVMALREYLQDLLGISDEVLLRPAGR